jgi:hypothetical protein
MFDNETLTAGDLAGRGDVVVTIESAKAGAVKVKGGKKRMPLLKLSGFALPFGPNVTNCRTIERMHGGDVATWPGKRIALYVDMVSAPDPETGKGQVMTPAIRVRPTMPTGGDSPAKDPPPALTEDQEAQVRALCEAIDAADTPDAIEAAINPHRPTIKAIGGRAVQIVAGAKAARLATIAQPEAAP